MGISDRYSCQEHGQIVETGCLACEFYSDISALDDENEQLRAELSQAQEELLECQRQLEAAKEQVRVLRDRIEQARKALNEECYQKLAELLADDEVQQALAEVK